MNRADMERAIANATGESLRTIRCRGFSMMDPREVDFDPEPNDLPAQMVDWDHHQETTARRAA